MTAVAKLFRLERTDQRLILRALVLLCGIRLSLAILPFSFLRRLLGGVATPPARRPSRSVDRVAWAVMAASPYVPGARCLAQALAAQRLLANGGQPTRLCIGVARPQNGQLEAHAWLEQNGQPIFGTSDSERFARLQGTHRSWAAGAEVL